MKIRVKLSIIFPVILFLIPFTGLSKKYAESSDSSILYIQKRKNPEVDKINSLIATPVPFDVKVLTETATLHPNICDINKDGYSDIACVKDYVDTSGDDGTKIKSVGYFTGPAFEFRTIYRMNFRSCEMHVADIDGDGYEDIIGREDSDADDTNETGTLFWLRNPGLDKNKTAWWDKHEIGHTSYTKDIWHADFDLDGRTDIVARASDGKLHIFIQNTTNGWNQRIISVPLHDGMAVADIDNDGDQDIVLNGLWIETPDLHKKDEWIKHDYAPEWYSQKTGETGKWWDNNTKVTTYDMNGDGYQDILISQAESKGWPVCWYENPSGSGNSGWKQHIVGYMDYCHTLQVADIDNDGDPDVFCGELIPWDDRRADPYHPVVIFLNTGNCLRWERQEIDRHGCYGGKAGDVDNDGDIDLVAPRNYERGPFQIWFNRIK
jgi:hypothetical protein